MEYFIQMIQNQDLMGHANACYLSYPLNVILVDHKIRYLFTCGSTMISWRYMKQTITTTSSNHAEYLALHKISCECVWLRSIIQHVWQTCGLSSAKMESTIIYEDNSLLFNWKDDTNIQKIRSCENLTNLYIMPFLRRMNFWAHIHMFGLHYLYDVSLYEGEK